ncbi:LLM class flavin-dependent oxidoreductase [Nocardiopsis alba]|uniref:MsnO8 family LLM class oxidoreductase n=2 Tax=Nocardiopsis alba TaxID=53437 RepID=A0A7K2IVW9_9ACTN|nr:LLM class flavin-dependent oxidoreductase [Nocardiopsis alba]AFR09988.1 luciferase oxidoreductase, group 1 family protein [Nocardiopsis alba ATCC BAA-2165]MYR34130.1 MsnO8 family LLM class oxidoreductase [Nocardiopsis alba]
MSNSKEADETVSGDATPGTRPALSVLDHAGIVEGSDPGRALRDARELAQNLERRGYHRFWLSEHHNMRAIASAATSVSLGFIAEGTSTIRVGSGGVMLPNHSPLVIAEQFGTLESLYPGRIDLGLGRAPGTDPRTMRALRRDQTSSSTFPNDVQELQAYFEPAVPGQPVRAVPGEGLRVPLWILGSSLFGAQLAAHLGLPYAFASHFAPSALYDALDAYREGFAPSAQAEKPYAMAGINVCVADTDEEAERLFTSMRLSFLGILRNERGLLQPPVEPSALDTMWRPGEKPQLDMMLRYSFVGSPETVVAKIDRFVADTGVDELMLSSMIFDKEARMRSYELLADAYGLEAPTSG